MRSIKPTLEEIHKLDIIPWIFKNYHWHKIGKIIAIDFTTNIAQVEILNKKLEKNQNLTDQINSYPLLVNCPVAMNYNKTGGLLSPVEIGDEVLISFNDVSIEDWLINGIAQLPQDDRVHDINDGIIIAGLFNRNNKNIVQNYNNDSTRLWFNNSVLELKNKVLIKNSTTTLNAVISQINSITQSTIQNNNSALNIIQNCTFITSGGQIATMDSTSQASLIAIIVQNTTLLAQVSQNLTNINNLLQS